MIPPRGDSFRPLLTKGDLTYLRRAYGTVVAIFGTLAALQIAEGISVLPYVWVSDDAANCGARLILSRAADGILFLFICSLGGGSVFVLVSAFPLVFSELRDAAFLRQLRTNPFVLASTIPMVVAVVAMLGFAAKELAFLKNPPTLAEAGIPCAQHATPPPLDE